MIAALVAAGALAGIQVPALETRPLVEFKNGAWAGIVLGQDTDSSIKQRFKGGKGAVRPEGLLIPTDSALGIRVDALMDGRGGKAKVQAIRVEYDRNAPTLPELQEALGEEAVPGYQAGRWEDWILAFFPKSGIVGVVAGETRREAPRVWFLASPDRVARAMMRFDKEPTEVVEVPDPGEDWDRILEFGELDVKVDQSRSDKVPVELDAGGRQRIADAIEDEYFRRRRLPMAYNRLSRGEVNFSVTIGRFNDRDHANVTISASLQTRSPYGPLSASDSLTVTIKDNYRRRVLDAAMDLVDRLDRQVADKVSKLGPPPIEQKRRDALNTLMDDLTGLERR